MPRAAGAPQQSAPAVRVISSFRDVIGEDAVIEVGEGSLALDTARYQLGEQARASGVRFQSVARGASCGQGYWCNELTLFLPEGSTLRPVAVLHLYFQRWLEGCPAAATDRALWEDAQLTVRAGTIRTNGLFDLIVTASIGVTSMNISPGQLILLGHKSSFALALPQQGHCPRRAISA